jgi:hypothetical protein
MIIEHGNTSRLKGKQWFLLETSNERTVEGTLRRVGRAMPQTFKNEAVELFVPVQAHDLDVFEIASPYLFIRSTSLSALSKLRRVTGVGDLVADGCSPLEVEDSYVQELIAADEELHRNRNGIQVGSFVRILQGQVRGLCGTVDKLSGSRAVVRIDMPTKVICVDTPVTNLLNLVNVPETKKVYFYSPLVEAMEGSLQ